MEPREVLRQYAVELLALPVRQPEFIALLDKQNLLPGNTKSKLKAMHLTDEEAAQLFVSEVERSLVISRDSFDKLVFVMKQYKDGGMLQLANILESAAPNPAGPTTYASYDGAGSSSGGTFDCSEARKMLKKKYDGLGNLSYSSMSGALYANDVITRQEKQQIERLIGNKQIQAVLDIVMDSLQCKQTAKYKGLLLAMENSEDILLKQKATELGGSHSVPE